MYLPPYTRCRVGRSDEGGEERDGSVTSQEHTYDRSRVGIGGWTEVGDSEDVCWWESVNSHLSESPYLKGDLLSEFFLGYLRNIYLSPGKPVL